MGSDKSEKKKPKSGKYRLGSAFLWGAAQWAVSWFVLEDGLTRSIAAAFGGLLAGWATATILGGVAKLGAGAWVMMIAGLLIGVAVMSGAVHGIDYGIALLRGETPAFNWTKLQAFLMSWSVVPALILGVITGLYVRIQIPRSSK